MNGPSAPPRKDAKTERVQSILSAALQEFVEQGFAAARLDAIAERAEIGKGTVYLYFDSKETLFEETVRAVVAPMIDHLERLAFNPAGKAEHVLREMITTFYQEVVKDKKKRSLMRLIISDGPRFPRLLSFYYSEVVSRGMAAIRSVLAYGVQRCEFQASPITDYPQIILGPALAGAVWTMLFETIEPLDLDALCEVHLDFAMRALKAKD